MKTEDTAPVKPTLRDVKASAMVKGVTREYVGGTTTCWSPGCGTS
ncbi:MAG: hypothetical protein WBB85_13740 [Albidovulum sp.]